MSMFKHSDIDQQLLSHCDLIDGYSSIKWINKYYYNLIINTELYQWYLETLKYTTVYQYRYIINKTHNERSCTHLENLFINACRFNIPVYEYLFTKYTFEHLSCSEAFMTNTEKDYLVLCYMHLPECFFDAHHFDDSYSDDIYAEAFINSCYYGYFRVAEWLLSVLVEKAGYSFTELRKLCYNAIDQCSSPDKDSGCSEYARTWLIDLQIAICRQLSPIPENRCYTE